MQMSPYLSFKGQCEEAFKCYERCLGGQLGALFRYAGTPMADQVPADWQGKIMHGSVTVGGQMLMGGDVAPDAERIFSELAQQGRVVMPLEKTFWAARFGMLVDRFGIPWLINCEGPDPES